MNKAPFALRKFLIVFSFSLLLVACKKVALNNNVISKNNIVMEGSQEVPAKVTTATGTTDIAYNKITHVLVYAIKWNNLSGPPTGMHFHSPCLRGSTAPVIVPITGFAAATSGSISGTVTLNMTTQKEDELLDGKWYSNIHTSANPGGEIRGQIEF